MTNPQLWLSVGIPSLLILFGIFMGNARVNDLRSEMKAGFASLSDRMGRLETRLDRLESRFEKVEDEIRKDHESRISRLEQRVFSHA